MAFNITQQPTGSSPVLTQSPVPFTLFEDGDGITSQSFQYILDLKFWRGDWDTNEPTASQYTLEKFPNESGRGIFDVGRILNSEFQQPVQELASNVLNFKADGYWRWFSGSVAQTGSHITTDTFYSLDGYNLFGETINQNESFYSKPWSIMTDGPTTQSFSDDDLSYGNLSVYTNTTDNINDYSVNRILYTSNLGSATLNLTAYTSSYNQIQNIPIGILETAFPLSTSGLEYFTVQAASGSVGVGTPIRFEYKCKTKYDNIRIKWKNRYGQFDYFNFDLVSRKDFSTETKQYQPQLGSWDGTSLSYQSYDTAIQNYATDVKQTITVNSDYISETYNDIFKQLLVSDEIYIMEYYTNAFGTRTLVTTPITIQTSSVQFKQQKVEKLIQYGFQFQYGQGYKLQF